MKRLALHSYEMLKYYLKYSTRCFPYLPTAIMPLGVVVAPSPPQYANTNNPTLSVGCTLPKGRASLTKYPKLFNISFYFSPL